MYKLIVISKQQHEEMLEHTARALPNEACGLLAGNLINGIKQVEKIYLLTNIDKSPEHFSMDHKEQFAAVKDMRGNGWVMFGSFHSHPASPSRPSEEDKRLAFDPGLSYLILSLQDERNPVLKSFQITNGQVIEEETVIEGE